MGGVVAALLLVAVAIFVACRTRRDGGAGNGNGAAETALQSLPAQEAPVYAPSAAAIIYEAAPAPAVYSSSSSLPMPMPTAVTCDTAVARPAPGPKATLYGALPARSGAGSPRYDSPTSAFEF